ncbi:MAG: hypothetical protein ACI4KI_02930 [Candidatus Fimenecus sp.]
MFDWIENETQALIFNAIAAWLIHLVIRFVPQIIMAFALHSEAKKHGKNKTLWGFLGFAFPIIAFVAQFIYIRYSEKEFNPLDRKGFSKKTIVCAVISALVVILSFAMAVSSFVFGAFGLVRSATTDEHFITVYDRMGNEYNEFDNTIDMFDRDGNRYAFEYGKGTNAYYVAEDGTKYDAQKCFIDKEYFFVYDENDEFIYDGTQIYFWIGENLERYKDKDGNKYFRLGTFSYWCDENGNLYVKLGRNNAELDFVSDF